MMEFPQDQTEAGRMLQQESAAFVQSQGLPPVHSWISMGKYVDRPTMESEPVYMFNGSYKTLVGVDGHEMETYEVVYYEYDGQNLLWSSRPAVDSEVFWQTTYSIGNTRRWTTPQVLLRARL